MKRRNNYNRGIQTACIIIGIVSVLWIAGRHIKDEVLFGILRPIVKGMGINFEYTTSDKDDEGFLDRNLAYLSLRLSEARELKINGKSENWMQESLMARGGIIFSEGDETNTEDASDISDDTSEPEQEENTSESEEITEAEGSDDTVTVAGKVYVNMPESVGTVYGLEQLSSGNFLINKFFTVPSSTKLFSSDVDISTVMSYDMTLKQDNSKPQILIYHTHSLEGYTDSVPGDLSTGVVGVGEYLKQILEEQFGYSVLHCTDSFDVDDSGKADRNNAYTRARKGLEEIIKENPSIEVILDIHRDGVDDSIHFVTDVNGKPTAKIMFFNGLCRNSKGNDIDYGTTQYRSENLAMSIQMKLMAEEFYPGFTRKNYVNAFHYNMNFREKSMLIEVGAQTNTFEEAKNAMEPLAVLLSKLLN